MNNDDARELRDIFRVSVKDSERGRHYQRRSHRRHRQSRRRRCDREGGRALVLGIGLLEWMGFCPV